MRDEKKIFQLIGETTASIYPLTRDMMRPLFEKHFSEQRFYGPTFLAFQLKPQPISAKLLDRRNPYNNPDDRHEILSGAAEAGYLVADGDRYRISDRGAKIISDIHQTFYDHVNQVNPIPQEKMSELAGYLHILVDAIIQSDPAGELFCFECSRRGHPDVESGTLAKVDQLLDDLNAFRDDAHIAAWKTTGIAGPTLEVLTLVRDGEANTPKRLVERLPYRTIREEDYQAELNELVDKGWIEIGDDGFRATAEGKDFRDGIEEATNKNYFAPWSALSDDQLLYLGVLLQDLISANQALVEEG